jgi:hypothetical protein
VCERESVRAREGEDDGGGEGERRREGGVFERERVR